MSKLAAGAPLAASAQERLGCLFDAHFDRLYRLARRLAASADDALDLVQETFLRAARSSSAVPCGRTAEEAWLVRTLVNIRRDQWRSQSVRRRNASRLPETLTASPDPERLYVLHIGMWRALDELSPRRRAVLVMHELEGLPVSAIASLLKIAAITVRWHLARARRELAGRITPDTGAINEHTPTTLAGRRPAAIRGSSKS
jgi:RNA polymerase sigma-70 factor (ECF subfamily)